MSTPISIRHNTCTQSIKGNPIEQTDDPPWDDIEQSSSGDKMWRADIKYPGSFPPSFKPEYSKNPNVLFNSYKKFPHKNRKCGYVIASIDINTFVEKGAQELISNTLYIMNRVYTGEPTGETCAIIGVNKRHIKSLFDNESLLYKMLKSCPQLVNVPGINELSPYRLISLKYLYKYMYFIYDRELILFNIEPKGDNKNERLYPCANICLPGGGMETKDGQCFETCAKREFLEETGFEISSESAKLITKQKISFPDRQSMYFIYRLK